MVSLTSANGCFSAIASAAHLSSNINESNFHKRNFCTFSLSPKTYNRCFASRIRSSSSASPSSGSGVGVKPAKRSDDKRSSLMDDYNTAMKKMMRNPYEYHHDLGISFVLRLLMGEFLQPLILLCFSCGEVLNFSGMNYTHIADSLIVGSQPQKPEDIDHLKEEENVAYILNLQQDKDIEYWGIDFESIIKRCKELGIRHMRTPARDFDPDSLRNGLPKAVSSLEWAISEGKGSVYVHCTAGLGRAPAVAIAYLFWFHDMDLDTAYNTLTSKRPCGPNKKAIRGATYDLAKDDPWKEPFESLSEHAFANVAEWERKLIQDRVRALRGT